MQASDGANSNTSDERPQREVLRQVRHGSDAPVWYLM